MATMTLDGGGMGRCGGIGRRRWAMVRQTLAQRAGGGGRRRPARRTMRGENDDCPTTNAQIEHTGAGHGENIMCNPGKRGVEVHLTEFVVGMHIFFLI